MGTWEFLPLSEGEEITLSSEGGEQTLTIPVANVEVKCDNVKVSTDVYNEGGMGKDLVLSRRFTGVRW